MIKLEKCHIMNNVLNSNPVLEARHSQFRFELLFKVLILITLIRSFLTDPWEKTHFALIFVEFPIWGNSHIHFFIFVEFPIWGNSHINFFIFIIRALHLSSETKAKYCRWLDNIFGPSTFLRRTKTFTTYKNIPTSYTFKNML